MSSDAARSLAQRRGLLARLRVTRLPSLLARSWRLSASPLDAIRLWVVLVRGFLEPHVPSLRTHAVRRLRIATRQGTRTVHLRENGSDPFTFYEIFLKQVYRRALPVPRGATVVDLGANIGMTALWLATRASDVRVIAVEPERSNYELLLRNVAADAVTVLHAAIAARPGRVALAIGSPSGHRIDGGARGAGEEQIVDAIDLDDLAERCAIGAVHVLKVDIEGAERAVFSRPWALVDRSEIVLMEIHDARARSAIRRTLEGQGMRAVEREDAEEPDAFLRLHGGR